MKVVVRVQYEGFNGLISGDVDKRLFKRLWATIIRVIELPCPNREIILAPENSVEFGSEKTPTNIGNMQCTCGYVRTNGKCKIYRVPNEFGVCRVHSIFA